MDFPYLICEIQISMFGEAGTFIFDVTGKVKDLELIPGAAFWKVFVRSSPHPRREYWVDRFPGQTRNVLYCRYDLPPDPFVEHEEFAPRAVSILQNDMMSLLYILHPELEFRCDVENGKLSIRVTEVNCKTKNEHVMESVE